MLLTEKYKPKKLEDIIGNEDNIDRIRKWILDFLNGKKRKPLLLYGPPGVGKTSVAYAIANEFSLDVLEMAASDLRNKKRIQKILGNTLMATSLFNKGKIILIDDADIVMGRKDSGAISAFKEILVSSPYPVIVTATDIWHKQFAPIRAECEKLEFKRINKTTLKKFLLTIVSKEGLPVSEDQILSIVENVEGDVRAALNDLQSLRASERMHKRDIFKLVRGIFKATEYKQVKELLSYDYDYNILYWWIEENIPAEYTKYSDRAAAFDSLSWADIYFKRTRVSWKMLKYALDLAFAGVALSKQEKYRTFTKYSYPSFLRNMSNSVSSRALRKSLGLKLGKVVHSNRVDALDYLHIVKHLATSSPSLIKDKYALTDEELAFILEIPVSKLRKIL